MGWKCTPQIKGLVRSNNPSGKHRANGKAFALEAGEERISQSDTLDRELSDYNQYEGYSSGLKAWLDIEKQADEYRSRYTDKNGVEKERKLKADAVVGFAVIFNPPEEVCSSWSDDEYKKFYNDSWEALYEIEPRLFRTENIVMSAEHYDEGMEPTASGETPKDRHKHYIGVSKDADGRFCGNLIDAKLLSTINSKYPEIMRSKGWNMDDLDVTDWDRYKKDDSYREERKKALQKSGKSVNEHIKRQLKAEKLQIERIKEYQDLKAEDFESWENDLITRENAVSERENDISERESVLDERESSYEAEIKVKYGNAYKSKVKALESDFKAKIEAKEAELQKKHDDSLEEAEKELRERLQAEYEAKKRALDESNEEELEKWKSEYKNEVEKEFQSLQDKLEAQKAMLDERGKIQNKRMSAIKKFSDTLKEERPWLSEQDKHHLEETRKRMQGVDEYILYDEDVLEHPENLEK